MASRTQLLPFRRKKPEKETSKSKLKDPGVDSYTLAKDYFQQGDYGRSEALFRESLRLRERALGKEHIETLDTKHWLGSAILEQHRYHDAESLFRETVEEMDEYIGEEKRLTRLTKGWLANTLFYLRKFGEAEEVFQKLLRQDEKISGEDHKDTLMTKHWLGKSIFEQGRYDDAELIFRQLLFQDEVTLGRDHKDTFADQEMLVNTLFSGRKYSAAERVCQTMVRRQERKLGPNDDHTLRAKRLLLDIQLKLVPADTRTVDSASNSSYLSDFFPRDTKVPYTDVEIAQISVLLQAVSPQWSAVTRTYIVLRNIDCLNQIDTFIDAGFSDYWFPVTERSLPQSLQPSLRSKFVATQRLIMTKSMDLEKSGQHCHFSADEPLPFEVKGMLGSGGFGEVHRIISSISNKEYARKRIRRRAAFQGNKERLNSFIAEIAVLKKLEHCHVVEFIGSYTDPKYVALIMSPVAQMDLTTYLQRVTVAEHDDLRTFFGCLSTALAFLHQKGIRHKDIKPGNILINSGNVLLTDFGLAFDFGNADGSTTVGMVSGMTRRYCAPEVALLGPRNTSSDIWSLGVVFLEMMTVLKRRTVASIYEFLLTHGTEQEFPSTNLEAVNRMIEDLRRQEMQSEKLIFDMIRGMLQIPSEQRPKAASLQASIIKVCQTGDRRLSFCGKCCMPDDDELSDSDEEYSSCDDV